MLIQLPFSPLPRVVFFYVPSFDFPCAVRLGSVNPIRISIGPKPATHPERLTCARPVRMAILTRFASHTLHVRCSVSSFFGSWFVSVSLLTSCFPLHSTFRAVRWTAYCLSLFAYYCFVIKESLLLGGGERRSQAHLCSAKVKKSSRNRNKERESARSVL